MTAEYKLTAQTNVVIRTTDGATIPEDNWLWDQYQAWLAAGNTPDPALSLADAQAAQLATVAANFAKESTDSVADGDGLIWSGGESSALSIYGAVQLAQAGGATTVTLFDASNAGHAMTIAKGTTVAAAISAAYQKAFAKYQGLKVDIAASTTIAEVQAITW